MRWLLVLALAACSVDPVAEDSAHTAAQLKKGSRPILPPPPLKHALPADPPSPTTCPSDDWLRRQGAEWLATDCACGPDSPIIGFADAEYACHCSGGTYQCCFDVIFSCPAPLAEGSDCCPRDPRLDECLYPVENPPDQYGGARCVCDENFHWHCWYDRAAFCAPNCPPDYF